MGLIYFLIAILATSAGAITGMGGGVIIKPAIDLLGGFDAASINMMSSIAVFCMTAVSIGRQIQRRAPIDMKLAGPLALGSLVGGNLGQKLLSVIIVRVESRAVVMIQNIITAAIILTVFFYMLNKQKVKPLGLRGILPALLTGLALGGVSSFLGIGGGPFNVAALIWIFSQDTKSAVVCSLVTIFCSQAAKLVSAALGGGFGRYDLSMLLPLVAGAVAGGFIGAALGKKMPERKTVFLFNGVLIIVLIVCGVNIWRGL